jgi:uncharacterized protein YraI
MSRIQSGKTAFLLLVFVITLALAALTVGAARAEQQAQIPTVAVATVTGTPVAAIATVRDNEQGFVNVRAGPSAFDYEIVGILQVNQSVPALGRSPGGDWIMIAYPGVQGGVAWVYVDLVDITGTLPIVDIPPTPTPRVTATIDPTLAAQFLVDIPATRLPTFTAPPPLSIPTYQVNAPIATSGKVPIGFIIVGMGVIGVFGVLISFLRGR